MTPRTAYTAVALLLILILAGLVWAADRYDDQPRQSVALQQLTESEYPDDPAVTSRGLSEPLLEAVTGPSYRSNWWPPVPRSFPSPSYERHALLNHFVVTLPPEVVSGFHADQRTS